MWFEFIRVVVVIALLIVAACLATPPGRLPLALRGIKRILSRDRGVAEESAVTSASASRRFIAFVLVVVAVALAVI
jgi:hypothetical protein